MSVVGNFFNKLRSLALTLEKEAAHLDQAFNEEDSDYEDEAPLRVLHDLRSEIMGLKSDLQGVLEKNIRRGDELSSFLKTCRVLQKRNAADIQQVRETFQKYGYKAPDPRTPEKEGSGDPPEAEGVEASHGNTDSAPLPPPAVDKLAAWDLQMPQLSDFGLSHYQLPTVWQPPAKEKVPTKTVPEEKPKPSYRDIRTLNVAKTPKCSLTMEDEDFLHMQNFGVSDYSTNMNDDYTIALFNMKKPGAAEKSKNLKTALATPAQQKYKNDFSSFDSPMPPVFCTPGLKVHNKGKPAEKETTETGHPDKVESDHDAEESVAPKPVSPIAMLGKDIVDTPEPPAFCTPGLKVQRKETTDKTDPAKGADWMKTDPLVRSLDITEPIPRPDFTHSVYLEQTASLDLEKSAKVPSPPKFRDFPIGTPPRPEMTMCLTEDLFKADLCLPLPTNFQYTMKPASPPKVSGYEDMLWTPTRPEITTCIPDDISMLLSRYCDNTFKPSHQDPKIKNAGNRHGEGKENRL